MQSAEQRSLTESGQSAIKVTSPSGRAVWKKGQKYSIRRSIQGTSEGTIAVGGEAAESTKSSGFGDRRNGAEEAKAVHTETTSEDANAQSAGATGTSQAPAAKVKTVKGHVTPVKVSEAELKALESEPTGISAGKMANTGVPDTWRRRGSEVMKPPKIDLECRMVGFETVYPNEIPYYCLFNVWMRNKGTQSPISVEHVLVRLIMEPEELVLYQEEWGFSGIYGQGWYRLNEPRKILLWYNDGTSRNLINNKVCRLEVELDPQNSLQESEPLRKDNKTVRRWRYRD